MYLTRNAKEFVYRSHEYWVLGVFE
jgi:hypothetical protein